MKFLRAVLTIAFLTICAPLVYSQVDPPPDSGFPATPPTPPANPVPITGAEFLIAAGAAFGVKKFLDARKGR